MRHLLLPAFLLCATPGFAQDAARLQKALEDTDVHPAWVYNDLDKAFAEAKRTGKPILAVIRCVV